MMATNSNGSSLQGLERQQIFLESAKRMGLDSSSFFITDKVMESMRDNGYRDVRKALNDLIDNSEQAGAQRIAVVTTAERGKEKNAREKISNIAVVDDGHGMLPEMLKFAIAWGGTDRHNQRDGLGRFGFGLPTAAISVTKTYEVYSKVKGGQWHKIKVDLKQIADDALTNGGKVTQIPNYENAVLPQFVSDYIKKQWKESDLEQGTVVLLISPDRIRSYTMPQTFQQKMLLNVGLTYRHSMPNITFYVNEVKTGMIDPLFLNPNCIGYDVNNGYKAEGMDELTISVKNKFSESGEAVGNIRFRFSYMHPRFQRDKDGSEIPARMRTMIENNAYFIVCRDGRQIDIVKETNYPGEGNTVLVNNDKSWAIELDFDPVLDELFGITTNKQQVEIDDSLWEIFKQNSIPAVIKNFRKRHDTENIEVKLQEEKEEKERQQQQARESETIMNAASKIDKATEVPDEKQKEADKKVNDKAKEIAEAEGLPFEDIVETLLSSALQERFKIEFASHPGAPFYEPRQWGPQLQVIINTAHRFYIDIYSQQDPRGKTAIELMLFVLCQCEIEAIGDKELFYGNERYDWSRKLELRLKMLDQKDPLRDKEAFLEVIFLIKRGAMLTPFFLSFSYLHNMQTSIVELQNFIIATRDSGYKSTASALAELVDNSIESGASNITIQINRINNTGDQYEIIICDDGCGMKQDELMLALQFGGSTRFNSRRQLGRYGMGLPNSSLSQCKRVEVYSWQTQGEVLFSYLDVDEVIDKKLTNLNPVIKENYPAVFTQSKTGTIVCWKNCDRLSFKYQKSLVKHVCSELGRIFRYPIWRGVQIKVCEEYVQPVDPLFLNDSLNLKGSELFGTELTYNIKIPGEENKTSEVKVKFVELPVHLWARLSNEEKKKERIIKNAGVSILRSEREIDYGWFFMGEKRKENYDDWWRCEISFSPELDELFGVTHTKQEIKETELLNSILVPEFEQTARVLNNRVRQKFISLKAVQPPLYSKPVLERADIYLDSIKNRPGNIRTHQFSDKIQGLDYSTTSKPLDNDLLFEVDQKGNRIILIINTNHVFYEKVYLQLHEKKINNSVAFIRILELLIFAAARSEFQFVNSKSEQIIKEFKKNGVVHLSL